MKTFHIHLTGCVQGVGFRPFVYRLARSYQIYGKVSNTTNGVHIIFNAEPALASEFYQACLDQCPPQAVITDQKIEETDQIHFHEFNIVESTDSQSIDLAITPDFGMCEDCRRELNHKVDRRFDYAFITCTNCGPRYSILNALPYDRDRTTMEPFQMCDSCEKEYWDPLDRRYFSQTNSCKECGISLRLLNSSGKNYTDQQQILAETSAALSRGEILAVKGIGGYLLVCDATNQGAIKLLRRRKHRPHKPFAVLYPNLEMLSEDVHLTDQDKELLLGIVSPILLLPLKSTQRSGLCREQVAPGLSQVGAMLPYAPLLEIISSAFGKPMIATSANLSGSPIIYEDHIAEESLFKFADWILAHDRDITGSQDDSVIKFSPRTQQNIILRRSRGLAPNYYQNLGLPFDKSMLALGAEMKGSFAVKEGKNVYVSQYLGDLESYESQQNYRHVLDHFLQLVKHQPDMLLADLHPDYFSTRLARELSDDQEISVESIQHHEAHFAAVLAENELLDADEKVLGVIWDGTGYGHDGQIWGGEFMQFEEHEIQRISHFEYFPSVAGDKMAKEPRLCAFSLLDGHSFLQKYFSETEWKFYRKLLHQKDNLQTSSVGRIFDAVAFLLGLLEKVNYEGQGGLLLEQLAQKYLDRNQWNEVTSYNFEVHNGQISIRSMMSEMLEEIQAGCPKDKIAAKFHQTLVSIIRAIAEENNYFNLAFSGGVFQNGVLVDLIKLNLADEYHLYFHKQLSPNDENISFGQLIHRVLRLKSDEKQENKYPLNLA